MNDLSLSVIIPVYNAAPYLRRCLDSVLGQTRVPDEIICVDDGSTDDSYVILNEYAEYNESMILIKTENHGEVAAKKLAIKYVTSQYVTFVDSDDWIDDTMYDEMLGKIKQYDVDVVTSGLIRDYGNSIVDESEHIDAGYYSEQVLDESVLNNMIDLNTFFRKNVAFNVVNKIFRKEILYKWQNRVPNSISVGEDICVSYPAIMDSKSIYVTGKNYYHYCIRDDSVMGAMNPQVYGSIKQMLDYMGNIYVHSFADKAIDSKQYLFLNTYMRLFWKPEDILTYDNGYLKFYGFIPEDSRVVIYGAGGFGVCFERFLKEKTDLNVVAWVDKSAQRNGVQRPDILHDVEFDIILIAILIADIIDVVYEQLRNYNIPSSKIYRISPSV